MTDWRDDAACKNSPSPELWYPSSAADAARWYPIAADICRGCPVRDTCLTLALKRGEQWGMWGGYTEQQRKSMRRQASRSKSSL